MGGFPIARLTQAGARVRVQVHYDKTTRIFNRKEGIPEEAGLEVISLAIRYIQYF